MVDQALISRKMESLARCVVRVEENRKASADQLSADVDAQDILCLNLERAVQLCVDMGAHLLIDRGLASPETMGDTFDRLVSEGIIDGELGDALRRAVGFRNLSVHAYEKIDWTIVHRISREGIEDLRRFGRVVADLADL